jgi:hypothetical protein
MVVVAALRAAFRVAARPDAHVHGVDGSAVLGEGVTSERLTQGSFIDPSFAQRGVQAAPAATMQRFEAQVNGRRNGVRGEEGVGELEGGIGPAVEAFVERVREGA